MMPSEGFPSVKRNPFGRKPLEESDADLLVGREDVLEELRFYLNEGNDARLLLLAGPSGSGRTSLMRVLKGSLQRAVHVVDVDPDRAAADLMGQIQQGLIGGQPSPGPNQATDMLIQTLRRDHGQALIVLDLPVLDGEHLPQILSKSMAYLERLDALIVVIATPEHAARFGASLVARFTQEFTLEPFSDEDIANMIDVRVRRENQLGWRPRLSWIQDHLHHLPLYPRQLLQEMSRQYMAHQRGDGRRTLQAKGTTQSPPMDAWEPAPADAGLELDMDDLDGAREQDAPPPIRPSLDDVVDTGRKWMEDFGQDDAEPHAPEPAAVPEVPSEAKAPAATPREPLVSQVSRTSPFGRIAHRSIAASNETASASIQPATPVQPAASASIKDEKEGKWEFTDHTKPTQAAGAQAVASEGQGREATQPVPHASHDLSAEVVQLLQKALVTPRASTASPLQGLAEALTRLGLPHAGALSHRPLRVQALKELNSGQALVVEAASVREISPSDARLLARLGVKRARLSQICNGLHRDGVLDVAQRGRSRVFTLSTGARAQLKAWNLLGGEA